ncbi:hypothetical protein RHMOL_Rhmol04G0327100 [Rhododendron molle]|uniref:Uncharacterized protein n=1 Tax=Rhododendron molle TaxID=49168 RepID=A0ACC0P6J2_RHOML|nr:hypothetical protein RHMOL_Rhmol04G0327100 [Rhododendron molle]
MTRQPTPSQTSLQAHKPESGIQSGQKATTKTQSTTVALEAAKTRRHTPTTADHITTALPKSEIQQPPHKETLLPTTNTHRIWDTRSRQKSKQRGTSPQKNGPLPFTELEW